MKMYSSEIALIGTAKAINELIINNNFDQALNNALKILGIAFDSDCFISKIERSPEEVFDFKIEHHYMRQEDPNRIQHANDLDPEIFNDMMDGLASDGVFKYNYSDARGKLKEHMDRPGGSRSGILMPIYIENEIWGVFSLSELHEERNFSKSEIAVLMSLTTAMSTVISKKFYLQNLELNLDEKTKEILYREKQIFSLIDNIPGIVFRCKNDTEWTMEYISQYVNLITGYSAAEFVSKNSKVNFLQIMHPFDREVIREEINEQLESSQNYQVTYRIFRKDGSIRWFWEQGTMPKGEEILEGCIFDITDKIESTELLLSTTLETEERERSRISREIHDNLQQLLTTAHLNLQGLKKKVKGFDAHDQKKFNIAFEHLQNAIKESRTISHRLMPKSIEDYGFQVSVESLLESLKESTSISFSYVDNLSQKRLPMKAELVLFRITQEAITNILKFSKAKEANIQLIKHPTSIILSIEDDGVGFNKKEMNSFRSSFGMNSMINRASSIGGQLYLDASIGRGTQLTIEVPLTKLNNEQNSNTTGG